MSSQTQSIDALCDQLLNGNTKPKVRDKRSVKKHVDRDQLMRWAQANIGIDPEEMLEGEIPTPAHASMLRFASDDPSKFWAMIAELDKRKADETATGKAFRDDNRRIFQVMNEVIADRERTAKQQSAVAPS